MFAITWNFVCTNNNETYASESANGSNTDKLYDNLIWSQWSGASYNYALFQYDLVTETPLNSLLIYNHNIPITADICLTLRDGEGDTIYYECWNAGTLDDGFGLMPFGLTGFGGFYEDVADIEPYNTLSKIFEEKHARYISIYITGIDKQPKIGFLNLGKTFVPKECDITNLTTQYGTTGTQNRSIAGTLYGNPSVSYRKVTLNAKLFNYLDLQEYVELTVNRNTSQLMFFTALNSPDTDSLPSELLPLKRVLSMLCYLDKDRYPKYSLESGHTSSIDVSFIEAL
jgi:hypothetical protein